MHHHRHTTLLYLLMLLAGLAGMHAAAGEKAAQAGAPLTADAAGAKPWIEVDYDTRTLTLHRANARIQYTLQRYGKNSRNDSGRLGFIKPGTYRLTGVNGAHGLNAGSGFSSITCNYSIGIEGVSGRSQLLIHDLAGGRRTNGKSATGQEYANEHPYSQGCMVVSIPDMKSLVKDLGVTPGGRLNSRLVVKGDGRRSYDASSITMNKPTRTVLP